MEPIKLTQISDPKNLKDTVNQLIGEVTALQNDKVKLQSKTVTPTKDIQLVEPDEEYAGLSVVAVHPIPDEYITPSGSLTITENNKYNVTSYAEVDVAVPVTGGTVTLQQKTVTPTKATQRVVADAGYTGLSEVEVTPIPDEYIIPSGTERVTANGVYDIKDKENVEVAVPSEEPNLTTKEITENGTYNASDEGADGYSSVTVNVTASVEPNTIDKTITSNGVYNASDDDADGFSTVKVSILSTEASPLIIDIPASFNGVGTIYYFQINNDRILMSGNVTDIGLWSYTVSTKTWKQVYAQGMSYSVFQMAGDKCLVGQDESGDVVMLIYSYADDEVILVSEPCNGRSSFLQRGDYWFCYLTTRDGGLDVYDPINNTLTRIISSGYKWTLIDEIDGNYLIRGEGSGGIYLFEPENNVCTQLTDSGQSLNRLAILDDTIAILSGSSIYSPTTQGAFSFNRKTKTIKRVVTTGANFINNWKKVSDTRWLIYTNVASSNSYKGIYLYDSALDTMSLIYATANSWSNIQPQDGVTFISSPSSSYKGVLLYDDSTQTITQIYTEGYNWTYVYKLGNKYLVTAGTNQGVLLYDNETKECTQIWGSGAYCLGKVIGDVCLLGGLTSTSTGILMYDSTTNEITQIYETGYYYNLFVMAGNDCLISSNQQSVGILLFDGVTKTITALQTTARIRTIIDFEDGNYLLSPVYSYGKAILLYDSATKMLSEVYTHGDGQDVVYAHKVAGGFLITALRHTQLLFYDTADKTLTHLGALSGSKSFVTFDDGTDCIFTSMTMNQGLDLYNIATKTITNKIYPIGSNFDIVEENELGALLSSSARTTNRHVVQYNKNDRTCTLVGYYIS